MTNELTKFLRGFYKSLISISTDGQLYFDNFINSIHKGKISFISVNTIVKSDEEDMILDSIESHIDHLWEINRRPRKFLQTEEVIRPVELSKNINTRTIYELSKNSAHWRRIKIDGVEPSKLLTELNDDDYEIYENRVYKTLLDKLAYILDAILLKNEQLRENVINANKISDNLTRNHKSARIFQKLAPDELQSLSGISVSIIDKKLSRIRDLSGRISFLRMRGLYQMLRRTRDVISPLNMTNILLQERNYKGMVELWNDTELYSITLEDDSSEEGELIEVTEFHYALYVYLFGLIVLTEMGYKSKVNHIGSIHMGELAYLARTEIDELSYKLENNEITITISEIIPYRFDIPVYLQDFFQKLSLDYDVKVSNKAIQFTNLTNQNFPREIEKEYKDHIKNASKASEKVRRFKNVIVDQIISSLRKNYDKKEIRVLFDVTEVTPSNATLWSYSNDLLRDLSQRVVLNDVASHYYIVPRIQATSDFDMKESIFHRFNNVGENYRCNSDKEFIDILSNYKGGIFTVAYDSLVSLTRFTKMINVHRYGITSVKNTLSEECPICGEKHINNQNNHDYSCNMCGAIWSESKCSSCNQILLYVREYSNHLSNRDEDESVIEFFDRLDLDRGPMAFTNGVFDDSKFKTICSNCGEVMG